MIAIHCDYCHTELKLNSYYHCIGYCKGLTPLISDSVGPIYTACDDCWKKMNAAVNSTWLPWEVVKTDRGGTQYICPKCKKANAARGSKFCPNCGIRVGLPIEEVLR